MVTSISNTSLNRRTVFIAVLVLIVIGVVAVLELTNVTHLFHQPETKAVSGAAYTEKGAINSSSPSKTDSKTASANSASDKTIVASSQLVEPSGNFVSNHRPNLSGSPAPNTMSSVCNTVPGATCQIRFVMGDTTKSLPPKTADPSGGVFWSWTLQDIGLSAGTWKVQAVASLNEKTKSVSDSIDLVVSP